jgi:phosphatidylethanolamine-binding protein (PEBP) family uncharacterized protein
MKMRSLMCVLAATLACAGCGEDSNGNDGNGGVMVPQQPPAGTQTPTTPVPMNTTPVPMDMTPVPMDMTPVPMDMTPVPMDTTPVPMDMMGTAGMMAMDPPMTMAGPLSLSSPEFSDGAMIPARFRCDAPSPAFTIGGGPEGTMSYAIVMTDLGLNLLHWVIYDIPAGTTMLAEGVPEGAMPATPAGAKQAPADNLVASTAGTNAERYIGPCAPFGTSNYEFKLYAVGEAAFSGASAGATGPQVKMALESMALESTAITISSMP